MKAAVTHAKLGQAEKLGRAQAPRRQARALEAAAAGPSCHALAAEERARSPGYGGRSVFGWERPDAIAAKMAGPA